MSRRTREAWSSDTVPSLPVAPSDDQPIVHVFEGTGFGFTTGGICMDVSPSDLEELSTPHWAPVGELP